MYFSFSFSSRGVKAEVSNDESYTDKINGKATINHRAVGVFICFQDKKGVLFDTPS